LRKEPSSNRRAIAKGLLALEEDRARAEPLLAQLQAGTRHWQDLTGPELRLVSRGPLIDFLLKTSYSLRFEDPPGMLSLAKAACAVADRLGPRRYGKEVVADIRARTWAEQANAYRVLDDLEEAGVAFARAQELVGEGTRSSLTVARVSEPDLALFRRFAAFSGSGFPPRAIE
jgi:hypothetical protein